MRRFLLAAVPAGVLSLAGCAPSQLAQMTTGGMHTVAFTEEAPAPEAARMQSLISHYAATYHVPESLVHQVVAQESGYDPAARNGGYWGLMQISVPTARTMGFRGSPPDLLDAETNLKYAVKYLAGAYMVANHNPGKAIRFYRAGYYYDAKRKGLLVETGLGHR